jgi:hypothetical protein
MSYTVETSPIVQRAINSRVVDIGQLTDLDRFMLDQYVKHGVLIKYKGGPFPVPKTVYSANPTWLQRNELLLNPS